MTRKSDYRLRFWNYIDSTGPSGCWLWTGTRDSCGYGMLKTPAGSRKAHRISWEVNRGEIPEGAYVLHDCDTPACVNPAHLHLGTQKENMRECAERGRATKARGERCHKAKLSESQVVEVRRLFADGLTASQLGRNYGVTPQAISAIVRRESWKHVA